METLLVLFRRNYIFGLPITTVILSYCIPVKVAKMLLNLNKI